MAKIVIQQTGSPIRRKNDQRATLAGLGLNRMGRVSTLEDTPSVRGMVAKVAHLVAVLEEKAVFFQVHTTSRRVGPLVRRLAPRRGS